VLRVQYSKTPSDRDPPQQPRQGGLSLRRLGHAVKSEPARSWTAYVDLLHTGGPESVRVCPGGLCPDEEGGAHGCSDRAGVC